MAVLDESGLLVLWERICMQIRHFFSNLAPGGIMITGPGGKPATSEAFGVRQDRETLYEGTVEAGTGIPMGTGNETLFVNMPEEDLSQAMELDRIVLSIDGQSRKLLRRHYGNDPAQDPCMLFGNTKYSGLGIPACNNRADTGEEGMIFYKDGILGVVLPDREAHSFWMGKENAALTVDGIPEKLNDLVTLGYYQEHLPAAVGAGRNSLIQQTGLASADGEGAMAVNAGNAGGQWAFAAGNGTAGGEYAFSAGGGTEAAGRGAAAFGIGTKASGSGTAAFGNGTVASARNAAALGNGTIAAGEDQVVFGRYNLLDSQEEYAEVAGIGQGGARANGRTLDWNGNEWLAGTLETDALILREADGSRVRITVRSGQLAVEPVSE